MGVSCFIKLVNQRECLFSSVVNLLLFLMLAWGRGVCMELCKREMYLYVLVHTLRIKLHTLNNFYYSHHSWVTKLLKVQH